MAVSHLILSCSYTEKICFSYSTTLTLTMLFSFNSAEHGNFKHFLIADDKLAYSDQFGYNGAILDPELLLYPTFLRSK